ncbi:MAG TPA: ATPase domain-containing protein [Magnetospirillaceae bacterium]|nr:ATPase domain-containing protein [Magnetospirillaceae bacterium]
MVEHLPRLPSGISGLDEVLGGGFIEGASYIVQGRPGAGKTILSNQIAFAQASAGRRVLYVTLLAETHDRLFQSLSTLDFFDKNILGDAIRYVSVFQSLRDEGLDAVVKLIREETQRQHATLLVFDGLLNARDRADTDLDIKTFIAGIQSQAAFVGCTVLFLASAGSSKDSRPEHTMVDGVLDLSEEVVGVRSYRQLHVRKSRGSASLGGYHQFEITDQGVTLYPRLEAKYAYPSREEEPSKKRVGTGIAGLDEAIGGGLPAGSVTVLVGPPGSGKTSFGLNFLDLAGKKDHGLHFGFYETPARLALKAEALGLDFSKKRVGRDLHVIWNPLTENMLDKLAHQLLAAIREHKIKRLLIDGVGGFDRAATHRSRLIEFFSALTNELRALNVTTIVTWESQDHSVNENSDPFPEISSILDNLVTIREVHRQGRVQRLLSILKVRDSAFQQRSYEFFFTKNGSAAIDATYASSPGSSS